MKTSNWRRVPAMQNPQREATIARNAKGPQPRCCCVQVKAHMPAWIVGNRFIVGEPLSRAQLETLAMSPTTIRGRPQDRDTIARLMRLLRNCAWPSVWFAGRVGRVCRKALRKRYRGPA